MPSVYDPDNFAGRVSYAAFCIINNRPVTRSFDTCFEMYDGAAVSAALVRRAASNPRLAANLPRYLRAEDAEACAKRFEGQQLAAAARQLRAAAQAAHAAWMASLQANEAEAPSSVQAPEAVQLDLFATA